ncbi:MAG: M20 family metallopeptidase [Pseudomonadota bacterium]
MTDRASVVEAARQAGRSGAYQGALTQLVARLTDGRDPQALLDYLRHDIGPRLDAMGVAWEILDNPEPGGPPFLAGRRDEDPEAPTLLFYGHGDTVPAMEGRWEEDRDPLTLTPDGDRLYGRGAVDNKGQHLIGLMAMQEVLAARGRLGFNLRMVIEMGEEYGSPGLDRLFEAHRDKFEADVLIASDGPRIRPERPTMFLGSRGAANITLRCALREGGHHSGNWGGLLRDPAIRMAHALASITGPMGAMKVPEWRPTSLTPAVREAIASCQVDESGPAIDRDWGEPGLSPEERVWGWNCFTVRAFEAGDTEKPQNAVPPWAVAHVQLRFVVGTDENDIVPALRRHLDREGFEDVEVIHEGELAFRATRLDPDAPWAVWAAGSLERTLGAAPAVLPNLGGSLPNDVFADGLGLPTIWVPHGHPACSQHAPNEHLLASIAEEGLGMMAGLWWDLGERAGAAAPPPPR